MAISVNSFETKVKVPKYKKLKNDVAIFIEKLW